jgi:hypothetical protein
MGVSHYKGAWIGKMPMCAICGGAGEGPRAEHRLTHGVSVWLCAAHRSDAFQTRRSGRDFVASLAAVWRAAGITTRRHALALEAHLRRVKGPNPRDRPGSYAWPELREQAEQRFAAGASLAAVERDIRAAAAREMPSRLPSARTFRRWFAEGRWLAAIRKQLSRRPAPPAHRHRSNNGRETTLDRPAAAHDTALGDRGPPT